MLLGRYMNRVLVLSIITTLFLLYQNCAPAPMEFRPTSSVSPKPGTPENTVVEAEFPTLGGFATVVYEDLFPAPLEANDRDYNDMVIDFRVSESIEKNGSLSKIEVYFVPRARSAGYEHSFYLSLDGQPDRGGPATLPMFNGDAKSITLEYYSKSDFREYSRLSTQSIASKTKDLIIYQKTSEIFGSFHANSSAGEVYVEPIQVAKLTIVLDESAENNKRNKFDIRYYRMMLYVHNTDKDIDLFEINPAQFHIAGSEIYPYAMVVSTAFKYPMGATNIDEVYPKFGEYRKYLLDKMNNASVTAPSDILNWFNSPKADSAGQIYERSLFH